jgi:glycosyltransferase involved in cell wall biosynthesis
VVDGVRAALPDVLVVDDGSGEECRERVEALGRERLVHVVRRASNGGKGAAVKTGFDAALALGYTHALQIDADGQHDLNDIPRFLEASRSNPEALVLGYPVFDKSVPKGRLVGRQITKVCTIVETGNRAITDAMCGYRLRRYAILRKTRAAFPTSICGETTAASAGCTRGSSRWRSCAS